MGKPSLIAAFGLKSAALLALLLGLGLSQSACTRKDTGVGVAAGGAALGNSETYGGTELAKLKLTVAQSQLRNSTQALARGLDAGTLCRCNPSDGIDSTVCGLLDASSPQALIDARTLLTGGLTAADELLANSRLVSIETALPVDVAGGGANPFIVDKHGGALSAWTALGSSGGISFMKDDVLKVTSLDILIHALAHEVVHKIPAPFPEAIPVAHARYLGDSGPLPHFPGVTGSGMLVHTTAACWSAYSHTHNTPGLSLSYLAAGSGKIFDVTYFLSSKGPIVTERAAVAPNVRAVTAKSSDDGIVYYPAGALCLPGECPSARIRDAVVANGKTYYLTTDGKLLGANGALVAALPRAVRSVAYAAGLWYLLQGDGSVQITPDPTDPASFVLLNGLVLRNAAALAMGAGPAPYVPPAK